VIDVYTARVRELVDLVRVESRGQACARNDVSRL